VVDKSVIPSEWSIPQEIRIRLGSNVGRQRPMLADDHLLLVTHAPPKPEDHVRVGRLFWRSPDGAWTSNELGTGIAALNKHLDEYEDRIAALDRQEEEAKTAHEYFEIMEQLTPIHRAARNLYQVLQETRKMCPEYLDIIDVRDRAYAIERTADLLCSGTQNSLNFTVAKRAEEQARASHKMATAAHRLNILASFFFPIITVTAILGVDLEKAAANFGFDPEVIISKGLLPVVFLGIILFGFLAGVILTSCINRPPSAPNIKDSANRVK
jgi:hypothetical protein